MRRKQHSDLRRLASGDMPDDPEPLFDNTANVKRLAESITLPDCPGGGESLSLSPGDLCEVVSATAPIRQGVRVTVKLAELVNGWARYYAGGVWFHQGDLIRLADSE